MKISILGLGYVGSVTAACLADLGHTVIGVDIDEGKVNAINNGYAPVQEKDLDDLIAKNVKKKTLVATQDAKEAIINSDISMICVGTPSRKNGDIDLSFLSRVVEEIAIFLKDKVSYHLIVIRSTVPPGTNEMHAKKISQICGKIPGEDYGVVSNPEFLREGSAVHDFYNPPYTIIGTKRPKDEKVMRLLYGNLNAPVIVVSSKVAEIMKYANNAFHALKITFANEIGSLCKVLGIDGHKVMDIVAKDTKLNISPVYLKPGFAFGGSCLPKDVRALSYIAKRNDVDLPVIQNILLSNEQHIKRAIDLVLDTGKKKIGFLGFSFKGGTDDLRESPAVKLIEFLIGKGFNVTVYDRNVSISKLRGKNKKYLEEHIPHISKIMVEDIEDLISLSEVIVVSQKDSDFNKFVEKNKITQTIIDLISIDGDIKGFSNCEGIC